MNGISQNKTLFEVKQRRIYKCILFHFAFYLKHTLYIVLQDTSFIPPHKQQFFFFSLCILKSSESLPGRLCLGSLGVVDFSGNRRSSALTHFDSGLLISGTFLPRAGSSCTLLFCLYSVSCTHWRVHSLADIIPPFLTILQFSSKMSNNWCTGLPCLCPLWIYCTGKQHKASLFPCLFSCLSSLCSQLLCHGLFISFTQVFCPPHLHDYVTFPLKRWLPLVQVYAFPF